MQPFGSYERHERRVATASLRLMPPSFVGGGRSTTEEEDASSADSPAECVAACAAIKEARLRISL